MLGLTKINYEQFHSAIKRFGYKDNLTEDHMKIISKQINLDYPEFSCNPNSIYHVFYRDQQLMMKEKEYSP